jgi:hypothetical protein
MRTIALAAVFIVAVPAVYLLAGDVPASSPEQKAAKLAAFRAFFSASAEITQEQVRERFGPPDRHAPLNREQVEEPPSWWYYQLDADEYIGVAIENKLVGMVVYFRSDRTKEKIRPQKT